MKQWRRLPTTRASLTMGDASCNVQFVDMRRVQLHSRSFSSQQSGRRTKNKDLIRTHCSYQQRSSVGEQEELLLRTLSYVHDSSFFLSCCRPWFDPASFWTLCFRGFHYFAAKGAPTIGHSVIEISFVDFKKLRRTEKSSHNFYWFGLFDICCVWNHCKFFS